MLEVGFNFISAVDIARNQGRQKRKPNNEDDKNQASEAHYVP